MTPCEKDGCVIGFGGQALDEGWLVYEIEDCFCESDYDVHFSFCPICGKKVEFQEESLYPKKENRHVRKFPAYACHL